LLIFFETQRRYQEIKGLMDQNQDITGAVQAFIVQIKQNLPLLIFNQSMINPPV